MTSLRDNLEETAEELGCVAFGIADLTAVAEEWPDLFENIDGEYPRAIVMGVRLQEAALDGIVDSPTPLYFHNYRQCNYQLDRIGWSVADLLQKEGFRALAVPASQIIKKNPMRGAISHRKLGELAGIGFRGRNNLLVHPEYGALMRYVTVLTDSDIPADSPYSGDACGSCRACISVCPAKAIGETSGDYILEACYGKLTEFTRIPFVGQHICGVCVKACTAEARKNNG